MLIDPQLNTGGAHGPRRRAEQFLGNRSVAAEFRAPVGQWHGQLSQGTEELAMALRCGQLPPGAQRQIQGGVAPPTGHAIELHHQPSDAVIAHGQCLDRISQLLDGVAQGSCGWMGQADGLKHLR